MDANRAIEVGAGADEETLKDHIRANPELVRGDPDLLADLGLRLCAANIVDFGPVALSRVAAAHERESSERRRLEAVSRANYDAQGQTHASVLDLVEASDPADLARRIDVIARRRFCLAAGVIALEGPDDVPRGWRALAGGQVDLVLGCGQTSRMGHAPTALGLFGDRAADICSVALVRIGLWAPMREGLIAFGAADEETFTADMGAELVAFLGRVAERISERWPNP